MNARFVLVEPSHPGNIGAAARALRVMDWHELVLVRPHAFPHADATAMAAGADDVLAAARICETLEEALAGTGIVFGTSARRRRLDWPEQDARDAGASAVASGEPVAFLFGRERTGLTNEELDACHYLLHIPTAADYGSLNLAQAVQIVAYELRMATLAQPESAAPAEPMPAHEDMVRFYEHLESALTDIGFLDPDNPRLLMRRLRRFFGRSRPTALELNILRGILKAAQWPERDTPAWHRARDSRTRPRGGTISEYNDQE
ncbi:MAG: RNA methyltransferase [Halofilum sp. (in: g-proteobacteria)]